MGVPQAQAAAMRLPRGEGGAGRLRPWGAGASAAVVGCGHGGQGRLGWLRAATRAPLAPARPLFPSSGSSLLPSNQPRMLMGPAARAAPPSPCSAHPPPPSAPRDPHSHAHPPHPHHDHTHTHTPPPCRQAGIVNFEPLRPYFLEVFQGSQAVLPGLPGLPSLVTALDRAWASDAAKQEPTAPALVRQGEGGGGGAAVRGIGEGGCARSIAPQVNRRRLVRQTGIPAPPLAAGHGRCVALAPGPFTPGRSPHLAACPSASPPPRRRPAGVQPGHAGGAAEEGVSHGDRGQVQVSTLAGLDDERELRRQRGPS